MRVAPSSQSWVRAACADLGTLLVDHAHCEKRAASTAVRYLFKYPDWPALVGAMSRLAREELVHFERVLKELEARGVPFRGLPSANYAAALFELVRSEDARARRVDELLCCALIEARSHERFVRLAAAVEDARLARFYGELAEAEARHGEIYVELAEEAAGGGVRARLEELTAAEAEIVARPGQATRMHAGG
ncbi:MAG TPA: tRNA isopentenyl-2-thiomethyl-A-37 hydroxylase MiaE [Polyangia bacterium]|nr:tRNA isopentenyl-2-thiomethyl-A-37 hydroxylase MiaE [Polyangia bacterium]